MYVYAGHGLTTIQHFLSRRLNDRDDEYGGPVSHRVRLLREILEDTLDEVDGRAAVACRICVDELVGEDGIQREEISEALELVGELPDLWDFMVGDWDFDSLTSRFGDEASQEQYVKGLKQFTTKPVVGVGRFTSPDTMVRMVREGMLDMIGSARPSDRRPVPAEEDRRGPVGRHPRVHRLQHLRLGRLHQDAAALHPESDHGRGVAARLAPRTDPGEDHRVVGARRRCRPDRAGGRDVARPARL